jgi:hypothetical protein
MNFLLRALRDLRGKICVFSLVAALPRFALRGEKILGADPPQDGLASR